MGDGRQGSMKPAGPDRVRELNEDMSGIIGERSQKRESWRLHPFCLGGVWMDLAPGLTAKARTSDHLTAGTRGSIVKEASADTIFAIVGDRKEDEDTRLVLRKQRSGPQGMVFPFQARLVPMGMTKTASR